MKKYILFFDIDGTIVNGFNGGRKTITDPLREAFRQLKQNGHLCFVATGRPFAYLNDDIMSVDFDGFILCNGAMAIKNNEVILEYPIPNSIVKNLVNMMEKNKNAYFLNYKEEVYFSKNRSEENELFGNEVIKNGTIYRDYDVNNIKVTKIEINDLEEKTTSVLQEMKKEGFEIVWYPKINYAEVTMPNATKGKTILKVLEVLNIPIENSIAFGDGDNDIEMLKVVGRGVAMGNGTKKAKEAADVVCETYDEEGIVRELQRLGLINKIL